MRPMLAEQKFLPRFIIGRRKLNNKIYADTTLMKSDTERKLQKVGNQHMKKGRKYGFSY